MEAQLDGEIERLEDLRQLNDHVRPEEIAAVAQQKTALSAALTTAPLRLDALRLVWRMP
jgi:ATP-dependent helicase HepA